MDPFKARIQSNVVSTNPISTALGWVIMLAAIGYTWYVAIYPYAELALWQTRIGLFALYFTVIWKCIAVAMLLFTDVALGQTINVLAISKTKWIDEGLFDEEEMLVGTEQIENAMKATTYFYMNIWMLLNVVFSFGLVLSGYLWIGGFHLSMTFLGHNFYRQIISRAKIIKELLTTPTKD